MNIKGGMMKSKIAFLHCLLVFSFLSGCGAGVSEGLPSVVPLDDISKIEVPFRENGYSNFDTVVFGTQEELDVFLTGIEEESGWNNREEFRQAIESAAIDFTTNNILIYRFTEPTGSTIVTPNDPQLIDGQITIVIDREVSIVGTADVAYYALAYSIEKDVSKIIIDNGATPETIDLQATTPINPATLDDISQINIAYQDSGYFNLDTLVITTQEEFDAFINHIALQTGWQDKEGFLQALQSEAIDFTEDSLLLYQETGPFDSNILSSAVEIVDGKATIIISDEVEVLVLGTPSYIFAYTVSKSLNEIVVEYDNTTLDLEINRIADETRILSNISQVSTLRSGNLNGFNDSIVLTSQDELDLLIRFSDEDALNSFFDIDLTFQELEERTIDFTKNNVLIFQFGASSSGTYTPTAPQLIDDTVTIIFDRYPELPHTEDIAPFIVAYEFEKGIKEVMFDTGSELLIDIEAAEESTNIEEVVLLSKISQVGELLRTNSFSGGRDQLVLTSQNELDTFISTLETAAFNTNDSLIQQIQAAETDFSQNNLLIYRFTESSGSVRVTSNDPQIRENKVTIVIDKEVPLIGTDDLAPYTLVYEVAKDLTEVVFDEGGELITVDF